MALRNIYAFHGADSKVGVTMTAQSAAQCLAAQNPGADILFLVLAGKQNAEFSRGEDVAIEKFKSKLDSGLPIRKSDLHPNGSFGNLFAIGGLTHEWSERYYAPKTAERLISDLSGRFDAIVIDSGSRPDNGLALGGLVCASKKYLVLAQSEAALRRYERNREIYRNMELHFDRYVINKYADKDPYTAGYIAKRLGMERASFATVALSECGCRAEREYKTIFECKDSRYGRDIRRIAGEIAADAGLGSTCKEEKRLGKILFGRLFKANPKTGAERRDLCGSLQEDGGALSQGMGKR